MADNNKVRAHIFVSGRVQGVFFRAGTRKKAKEFGVSGFVRNLPDGKVETVLEGEEEKVKKLIEWQRKGPLFAKIKDIEVNWENYKSEFDDFEIKN